MYPKLSALPIVWGLICLALTTSATVINVPADYGTIQAAVDAAVTDDTVLVADGNYYEDILMGAESIVLKSANGPTNAVILGELQFPQFLANSGSVEGFTFTEDGSAADLRIQRGNSPTIDNCVFRELNGTAIYIFANGATISNCSFFYNNGSFSGGIYLSLADNNLITDCFFYGNVSSSGSAVLIASCDTTVVRNCVLVSNQGNAVGATNSTQVTLQNLTITQNRVGPAIYFGSSYGDVTNSILAFNAGSAGIRATSSTINATYNDCFNNTGGDYDGLVAGVGSISVDPLFADTSRLDYTLTAGSPCIDAGHPDPAYNDPDVSRNDMGALYFGSAATDWDKDGIIAALDNCRLISNTSQANSDGDLLGDACDNCPLVSNQDQLDIDTDSNGDLCDVCVDTDNDGYGDPGILYDNCEEDLCQGITSGDNSDPDGDLLGTPCDNCPDVGNADQADYDGDGIGDACDECTDSDNDGFGDHGFPASTCPLDNCPDFANPLQLDSDNDGIGNVCDADCIDTDGDGFGDPWVAENGCPPDNCPYIYNPDQYDPDGDGKGYPCDDCCGAFTGGYPGNLDCSPDGKRSLADISKLIDRVYISKARLCCEPNGNCDADPEGKLNLSDITALIDLIYISKNELPHCL